MRLVRGSKFADALGVQFYVLENGSVSATFVVGEKHEGPPGYAHGGVLASILDEAMGASVWFSGFHAAAVHLDFDYQHAVPLEAAIQVVGRVERREGRKVFTSGSIFLADETIAVKSSGIFVEAPQLFTDDTQGFSVSPDVDLL